MLAVILAGGYGKRLRPITEKIPKNLIEIAGKPVIQRQIEWLSRQGINRFLVLTGYLSKKIMEFLGDGSKFGVEIKYSHEDRPLGTGGAIRNAWRYLSEENEFILVNGDIITDLSIYPLINEINDCEDVIGVLSAVPLPSPYGIINFDRDGYIMEFIEKPLLEDYWINAGVYVFRRSIYEYLPQEGNLEIETLPRLAREKKLKVVKYMGVFWKSIDSFKDIEQTTSLLNRIESTLKM